MPEFFDGNFDPALPYPVILGLAALAAVLALLRAFKGRRLRPSWLQGPVVLLRWAALALLAVILLNPSETVTLGTAESRSLVLIDGSASMTLGSPTRWREASAWTSAYSGSLTQLGLPAPELRVFGTKTQPVRPDALEAFNPAATGTLLAGALESVLQGGRLPDHIMVVSDGGVHDRQRLTGALAALRMAGLALSAHAVGNDAPPRNMALTSVLAPRMARPKSRVVMPVEIEAAGIGPDETLILTLRGADGVVLARDEFNLPPAGPDSGSVRIERRISYETGTHSAAAVLELSGPAGETAMEDNRFAFTTEIVSTKLRILFVEGTHVARDVGSAGHIFNDIELITKAWDATGEIEWDCLTPLSEYVDRPNLVGVKEFRNGEMVLDKDKTFPKTREEIFQYDAMFISDVPVGNFSEEQMRIVVDWVVERGGGFLMGGGYTTFDVGNYDKTPWERIIPVDMLAYGDGFFEHQFEIAIPESVRSHPIWQISKDPEENRKILEAHPPFTGMNRVRRAKPGALVLAVRPEESNEPVFAAQSYGRGRSIAYLPDPNGGWAKFTVGWGPPGGPVQGPHTELGHGENFVVNEARAGAATGPMPPHPSPWYGQFWVNVAKWLGENSIRWRRDKLSGKIIHAQANPGRELPVAAEVLAVTSPEALTSLDVGARIDIPGSRRVRLTYDRDRREFTGSVQVPSDIQGNGVRVLFDVSTGSTSLTDAVSTGLRITNREFTGTAPDLKLLSELAAAGGGRLVATAEEAAEDCRAAVQARAGEAQRTWRQPLWTRWPWWGALIGILSVEWLLRRKGGLAASKSSIS